MSSLRMFSVIFFILTSCSLVSSYGNLRIELTASNNCEIRLITDYSDEIIHLTMGDKRTTSFHTNGDGSWIRVGLSLPNGEPEFYPFPLRNTGQQLRRVFESLDIVVLIESIYECDAGFFGPRCQYRGFPTTSSISTSTIPSTTTFESKESQQTTTDVPMTMPMSAQNYHSIIIVILVIVIITLTLLIIVFGFLLFSSSRHQHIIIADTAEEMGKMMEYSAEKKKKQMNGSIHGEPRYTSEPIGRVFCQMV
ncbi:unnamed protein product [Caenorhabditis brenneri]